jgi:hypothetical protein
LARQEKLDHPVSYSELSGFDSFQNRNKEGAKLKDLKIQGVLRHGKILKGIKEPRWKKSKQKSEVAKTRLLDIRVFNFPRIDRVQVGFKI